MYTPPATIEGRNPITIHTASLCAIGAELAAFAPTNPASGTWLGSGVAVYIPFSLVEPFVVRQVIWYNGGTAANNMAVGVYDRTTGQRMVDCTSTARSGTSVLQAVDITDVMIPPGKYWLAGLQDTVGTGTNFCWAANTHYYKCMGVAQESVGSGTLPATCTPVTIASQFVPWIGISGRTLL